MQRTEEGDHDKYLTMAKMHSKQIPWPQCSIIGFAVVAAVVVTVASAVVVVVVVAVFVVRRRSGRGSRSRSSRSSRSSRRSRSRTCSRSLSGLPAITRIL